MTPLERARLRTIVDAYWMAVTPEQQQRTELDEIRYRAFKARLMLELACSGHANEGVVFAELEERR